MAGEHLIDNIKKEDWREQLNVRQKIAFVLDKGLRSDVEFLVGDRIVTFKAHKLILSIASPVFDALFYESARDSKNPIKVPDLDHEGFQSFLRYIYTGDVEFNTADDAYKAYLSAEKYIVSDLKAVCREQLCQISLEPNNVWNVLKNAMLMEAEKAQEKCVAYISRFPGKEIFFSQYFLATSLEAVEKALRLKALLVPEGDVLEGVALWGRHHANRNNVQLKELVRPLLRQIRFDALTVEQCCYFTEKYRDLMSESDSLAILKHLINKECYKLPEWCSTAGPRETVTDCTIDRDVYLSWSNNTILTDSFSSTYYLTLKSKGYSPSNWFNLECVELGWEYCGAIPKVFDATISLYTSNYALIRKKLKVKAGEMKDEEEDSNMRIWIPVEWDKNYSQMYIITFHVTFSTTCHIRLLETLCIPESFTPCRWVFQTDNFPCVSDVIVNSYTSENVPKYLALQQSAKKYTHSVISEEVETFNMKRHQNTEFFNASIR